MYTELSMINGAKIQYRNYFRTMAMGGKWHLYRAKPNETLSGVILAPEGDMHDEVHDGILVSNVQAMAEQTMVNALSIAARKH